MSFNIRSSTIGAFSASTSISQVVNAAQTPIYEPPENIDITSINTNNLNTTSLITDDIQGQSGYNSYQTLGTENIVNPPSNTLTVGGVNVGALNKRTRTSYGSAERCVSTWTQRVAAENSNSWNSICWAPELSIFCAVSGSGDDRVMTSPDGIAWTTRTSPADAKSWVSICWSPELGLFCAVSFSGSENTIMTSPDGITWTARSSGFDFWPGAVCWSPELGLFCATSTSSPINGAITSPDGVTWSLQTTTDVADSWGEICWSSELGLFCAVGRPFDSSKRIMTSPDGITWTLQGPTSTDSWRTVCWSPELGLFCAIAGFGDNRVATSPDGVTWTYQTAASDNRWMMVCWAPELSLFCAVSETGSDNRVMTSPDGINWTSRTSAANESWKSVCWSPELSLFCAIGSENEVMTSAIGMPNSLSTVKAPPTQIKVTPAGNLGIATAVPTEKLHVTGNILATGSITPFTGAHVVQNVYTDEDIGKIVSSTGHVQDITINNAWPTTVLSTKDNDPAVYGVISQIKDDTALVNGVGEGGIWVCDKAGPIFKGDLLTTSTVVGYTQKQTDVSICSHTAARAVMDCSFDAAQTKPILVTAVSYSYKIESTSDHEAFKLLSDKNAKYYIQVTPVKTGGYTTEVFDRTTNRSVPVDIPETDEIPIHVSISVTQPDGTFLHHDLNLPGIKLKEPVEEPENKELTPFLYLVYETKKYSYVPEKDADGTEKTIPAYQMKYVNKDGKEISIEEYKQSAGTGVYKCAFIACIYLCG